jgi:hypothetical protein
MSATEHVSESKSSIAIAMNAKGEAQPTIKIYEGTDEAEVERIRLLAVATWDRVVAEVRT